MTDPGAAGPADGGEDGAARPRVVVVGAGFAGLFCTRRLAGHGLDVVLVDRNNYHTFFPLLYQVAAAELGPTDIAYPVRAILRGRRDVAFRMAEVRSVDLEGRTVETDAERISWDHLVLAPGSVPHFFGVEGAEEHGWPLRDMGDAIPLRHQILSRFETALYEADPDRRRRLLTFVIVGGGATGVEYAGALAELVYGPLLRDYPGLERNEVRIVLLEAMDRILLAFPERLARYTVARLESRNVEVVTGAKATRVTPDELRLADRDAIPTETVVWTAGVRGDPAVAAWGFPVGKGGRVQVDETLRVPGHSAWVAGDLALVTDEDGAPLPQVAPVAIQQGEHVADNILRSVRGEAPEPFVFDDPGMLAVIGRNAAVADLNGRTFTGFPAWFLWLVIHIAKLVGFRNRVLVLVNWAWNYLSFRRAVRLILPREGEAEPIAPDPVREGAP